MKSVAFYCLLFITFSISGFAQNARSAKDTLPAPFATKSVKNFSNVIGWEDGQTPQAPAGFKVTKYADGFDNPRWVYVAPNGDVFIAESNSNYSLAKKVGATIMGASKSNDLSKSADRITMLRDKNRDGIPEEQYIFLENLNQPLGMLILGDWFYVGNTDAIVRFPYKTGQTKITDSGQKIIDLPGGKRHWTKNIIYNPAKNKIMIGVGSGSNIAEDGLEQEILRACILEINPDGTDRQIFASGLRNPVGMDYAPGTTVLYAAVNERDELGDELVPDYLTHVVEGGFYGWPYSYFGQHIDPRVKEPKPEMVKKAIVPDVDLGSHTASLGLAFCTQKIWPAKYHNGAFIGQHGSWNRSVLSGYKVVFVPFKEGKPSGRPQDFLTGFIADLDKGKVHGRPVGIAFAQDGAMLVADDVTNTIWRVSPK